MHYIADLTQEVDDLTKVTPTIPIGCDHIEVYGIRYTLYDLLSAADDIK